MNDRDGRPALASCTQSGESRAACSQLLGWAIFAATLTVLVATAFAAPAASQAQLPAAPPLTFGIYPGGGAGTVGPAGPTVPEDAAKTLAALRQLRVPGRPFVLHIFASYTGADALSPAQQVGDEIAQYTAAGFQVELVLTYRPVGAEVAGNVRGFVAFARAAVAAFGSNRRFVAIQITNEANVRSAPGAADGAYAGAEAALIAGVEAAKAEARKHGFDQLRVGFNWAASGGRGEAAFWRRLGRVGGAPFRESLDWVGLDVYPETWGPKPTGSLAAATGAMVLAAVAALRDRYMPLARLRRDVPLHISENGYPTGPGRTEAMQVAAMKAAVSAVEFNRSAYDITDYRWFDLRDADSSGATFESRYGLMHDDYTPKPAFATYRKLIAQLAASGTAPARRVTAGTAAGPGPRKLRGNPR